MAYLRKSSKCNGYDKTNTILTLRQSNDTETRLAFISDIADVHHVVETTIDTFSLLLNILLLYLIKRYSTFGVKIYKYMLTIDALLDLCLSVFTFFAQPGCSQ
ncbi:serpentine type 7TM GPCR chemoreceptor srd domain-containing protein [Ditylenchus destructor]|uniref:Serpentine type 7TM GPCR chemoreceptor srd domain-containing protein n=1 Tax=Ditylenchus destructor TaxID=166010 RepID=A0AAD4MN57_9BILA|nr:serpentine type 7TM GPCR chemoreceptor srd domain-containing protein [Ditylenchus destructor]